MTDAVTEAEVLAPPVAAGQAPAPGAGRLRSRLWQWLRPRRRWCWGTRLVLSVSVAWLLFVLTHLLASGRTSLWAPVDLMPPLLLLAVPALLLAVAPFARPIRWRLMVLLLLTAALGAGRSGINPGHLWHTPPPAPAGAISVVSWNTEFWDQDWRAGGKGFEPGFYRYLRELDADVYLLKEYVYVVGDLTAENLTPIERLERLNEEFPGYQVAVNGEQITISRFPILSARPLDMRPWLPERLRVAPPQLADYPSYLAETLRTDLDVNGTVMSFYNTHTGQPPMDVRLHRAQTRRENQDSFLRREASLRALRADVEGNPHPVVVGADLNTSPAMGLLRLLPPGLADHTEAVPSLYPSTWLAGGDDLWRIDWMLTTADVAVHRYEFLDPEGMSDHKVQRVLLSTTTQEASR